MMEEKKVGQESQTYGTKLDVNSYCLLSEKLNMELKDFRPTYSIFQSEWNKSFQENKSYNWLFCLSVWELGS